MECEMALSEGKTANGKKEGYWITYYANGNKRSEYAPVNDTQLFIFRWWP